MLTKLSDFMPVNVLGEEIFPSHKAKNLGVVFDSASSFSDHVSQVCKSCFYHIRDLSRIRRHLSLEVATLLANALVSSKLDYCNSLLVGVKKLTLKPLQRIQNILCRIVTLTPVCLVPRLPGNLFTGSRLKFVSNSRLTCLPSKPGVPLNLHT